MASRRHFIAGLGAATITGIAPAAGAQGDAGAAMDEPEFLHDPGLIHLNTGTFGLMPRAVRARMAAATRQFERNPVPQGYREAPDTVLGVAEAARATCAALPHCAKDELLVTHGTADAPGPVASSLEF